MGFSMEVLDSTIPTLVKKITIKYRCYDYLKSR